MGRALIAGYVADAALGDPDRWHPVAGFGRIAMALEQTVYAPSRVRGAAFALSLAGGATVIGGALGRPWPLRAALVWAALGGRSLVAHACAIASALDRGELETARAALPALAGRDPELLDERGIARAVAESLAENTGDAVVGPLVWGALAGPPGVAAYRAVNTLDAMFGHRSERYQQFGWAAARLDDLVSWPGARLGALLAVGCAPVVGGSSVAAWKVLRRNGASHPSPNAGQLEAAFAGALDVTLGGPLSYGGRSEIRAALGDGARPDTGDIRRAARLSTAVGITATALCAAVAR
ncbi:MAG TPA: CobD/CbiB family cobalamin biosynthesis protein [Solirubrobacteraceae bacterium]|nr:CobD/CbiB family cobalamin biosynthesis protein [Solirubrobacteraceae bacterium]